MWLVCEVVRAVTCDMPVFDTVPWLFGIAFVCVGKWYGYSYCQRRSFQQNPIRGSWSHIVWLWHCFHVPDVKVAYLIAFSLWEGILYSHSTEVDVCFCEQCHTQLFFHFLLFATMVLSLGSHVLCHLSLLNFLHFLRNFPDFWNFSNSRLKKYFANISCLVGFNIMIPWWSRSHDFSPYFKHFCGIFVWRNFMFRVEFLKKEMVT